MPSTKRQTPAKKPTGITQKAKEDKAARARDLVIIKPDDLLSASQEKLCLALSYLDVHQLSVAKATELISVIKQLFDITQVLQGKPTTITANNNRKALTQLIPLVLKEAERRGLQVAGQVIEGEVTRVKDHASSVPSAKPRGGEGTRHTPPGASDSGPIAPRPQSEFSKLLDDF